MNEIEELKQKIFELELKVDGKCPDCKNNIKGWKPASGSFAPEWWQTMRENGIDPATGHSMFCKNKSLKI
jgi:hypothetical protein